MPRTCEENLAHRAWASQPRKLPKPAPTPAYLLRHLIANTKFSEPVWARSGRTALASEDPIQISKVLKELQAEVDRLNEQATLVETILPNLSQILNAA
jgi:hypothetical protein